MRKLIESTPGDAGGFRSTAGTVPQLTGGQGLRNAHNCSVVGGQPFGQCLQLRRREAAVHRDE